MGCDIHMFTERKRTIHQKEKWVNVDHFKLNPYFSEDEGEKQFTVVEIYGGRNYQLFSMLADVRNYHDTPVICQPKGLPNDCSEFIKSESDRWGSDGHSHSWLTLKELKEFREKNRITKYAGWMLPEDAKLVDNGEMPNSWCQGTNAANYVYREWEFESDILGGLVKKLEERLRDEFWIFNENEPTTKYDEQFRIVFWFDN